MRHDSIHTRLRQLLSRLGWSQERLGQEIKSDPATISRWFNGRTKPSKTTVKRIAHAAKADYQWLLTGEGNLQIRDEAKPRDCNNRELLDMAAKILSSDDEYRQALATSIKMFYRAMSAEKEKHRENQETPTQDPALTT